MKSLIVIVLPMLGLLAGRPLSAVAAEPFTTDVFVGGREGYPIYRIPAMVVTKQGTLLAFCEGRKTGILDHGNLDVVLKRSFDRGATWGPLQVIEKQGFRTWGNPAPVVDQDTGKIWLPLSLDNQRVFITSSQDDGATWAKPNEITDQVKPPDWKWYATGPGHSIQLASGRLLVPCDHTSAQGGFSHVIFSDDHGQTWKVGGSADLGTDESMAVETEDGRVYLTLRNLFQKKQRAFAWSADGGQTWSPLQWESSLKDSICQASILRLTPAPGKDLILFLNPASEKRRNLSIRISSDGAKTWSPPRTIYPGPAAYSDLAFLPDSTVGALYENGRFWPYTKISFTRMELEWITGSPDRTTP